MDRPLALDTRQAAALLSVSPRTLDTLRCRGGGPPYSKVGGKIVYRLETLERYLKARERRSTSEQPGAA